MDWIFSRSDPSTFRPVASNKIGELALRAGEVIGGESNGESEIEEVIAGDKVLRRFPEDVLEGGGEDGCALQKNNHTFVIVNIEPELLSF